MGEKRDNGFKVIAVIALLIATVGLAVAYAGYTTRLTISGDTSATVASAWKIVWSNLDSGTKTGYASTEDASLAIDSSTNQSISGVIGTLKAPGDSITYTWKAENKGDIDAILAGISKGNLTCKAVEPATTGGAKATDEQVNNLCSKLKITFGYESDTDIDDVSDVTSTNLPLDSGDKKSVSMTLTYEDGDAVELDGDVKVTLGLTTFTYNQKATD